MNKATIFVGAITICFCVFFLFRFVANSEVQIGVRSGDWMKYSIVTEELNWTGWERFDIYEVKGALLKFNATSYSESFGYEIETGQFDMSEMEAFTIYPNDVIKTIVIPANLKVGDQFSYYDMGPITIAGETSSTYLGTSRSVIYATYIPPAGMPSEASRIDYKWDKTTGIVLEFLAVYPDGKISTSTITDTNIWQSQDAITPYVLWIIAIVAAVIVLAGVFFGIRKKPKTRNRV